MNPSVQGEPVEADRVRVPTPDEMRGALAEVLARVGRAEHLHSVWRQECMTRTERLQRHFEAALKEHRSCQGALDDPVSDPADPDEARARTRRYRAAVYTGIMTPFREEILEEGFVRAGAVAFSLLLKELEALAQDLPQDIVFPDPDDAWAPRPEDARAMRARKKWTRTRRGLARVRERLSARTLRLFRRSRVVLPRVYGRRVNLRRLFLDDAAASLGAYWLPEARAHALLLAERIAATDDALTRWTNDVIAAERALDERVWAPDEEEERAGVIRIDGLEPVRVAAAALAADLAALAGEVTPRIDGRANARKVSEGLSDAILDVGSYRYLEPSGTGLAGVRRAALQNWEQVERWEEAITGSVALYSHLLQLHERLSETVDLAASEAGECGFTQVTAAMRILEDRLALASTRVAEVDTSGIQGLIEAEGMALTAEFQNVFAGAPPAGDRLVSGVSMLDEERTALAEALPMEVYLRISRHPPVRLEAPTRSIALREIAADSFSLPLAPRVAGAAEEFRRALARGWTEAAQGEQVVAYNQQAALEEAMEEGADAADRARQLFLDGLQRAGERLVDGRERMEERFYTYCTALFRVVDGDWRDFYRSVDGATRLEAGLEQFRARFRRWSRRALQSGRITLGARSADLRKVGRLLRSRTGRAVRRGKSVIGVSTASVDEREQTVDVLAGAAEVRSELPIIYRRLFSVSPVKDASFLVGRAAELAFVRKHVERWAEGKMPGGLIVTGGPGSGRTSLLNIVPVGTGLPSVHVTLSGRIEREEEIASILADALELEEAASLDALEARLLAVQGGRRALCLIDGLEYLVLRAPGGRAIIDRLLVLFSRTGASVCWVATCTLQSWRYVQRASVSAASLVAELPLTVLQAEDLEDAILLRHRRTGIVLRFAEPDAMSPLLRQRLRKARREEDRQAILSTEYFERLYRHSGRNVPLAYHYWLRSADFAVEPGALVIRPIAPLSWAFLGELDLASSFSLHALHMHSELAPATHARVLRMPESQSVQILQRFLGLHLIERADGEAAGPGIDPDAAYRLNPLALQAVAEHLRARRILY